MSQYESGGEEEEAEAEGPSPDDSTKARHNVTRQDNKKHQALYPFFPEREDIKKKKKTDSQASKDEAGVIERCFHFEFDKEFITKVFAPDTGRQNKTYTIIGTGF